MDLGLAGKKAIVCASSRGLGRACAEALAAEGVAVVMNGRDAAALKEAAEAVRRASGVTVTEVAGDVGEPAVREALVAACPEPDILVNNNGGPGMRDFREADPEAVLKGVNANMITPIEMIRSVVDGMIARRFGRIVNITSASVKLPLTRLDISSGARAGLTAFLAGPARQVAEHGVTINHILPGTFATTRFREVGGNPAMIAAIPAKRAGEPEELGRLCAYLCSVHAGYITGQSIVIDGGRYPGVL
jgi:3-oxoacyl-[acyl-carrier protein] reductase